jgi:hypothetical protein
MPGTPNKKTALISAAFAAAASKPDLLPLDFLLGVMRDPPDWRITAAQAAAPYVHPKPERTQAPDPATTAKQVKGPHEDPLWEALQAYAPASAESRRTRKKLGKAEILGTAGVGPIPRRVIDPAVRGCE